MSDDRCPQEQELFDRLHFPIAVRVWFETDGNAVPRWESGVLRQDKSGCGLVLDVNPNYGGGTRVFPLRQRTVHIYTMNQEPLVGVSEFGELFEVPDE